MTLISQIRCQRSLETSVPPPMPMPALEQKRSIAPCSVSTVSIRCLISASFPTLVVNAIPPISFAVAVAPSPLISEQTTSLAPSVANLRAKARPIPLAAPVTTTILLMICIVPVPARFLRKHRGLIASRQRVVAPPWVRPLGYKMLHFAADQAGRRRMATDGLQLRTLVTKDGLLEP